MARTGRPNYLFIVTGASLQLAAWLLIRPDRAGVEWEDGTAFEVWMGVEADLAVAIGSSGPDPRTVVVTVLAGWLVQILNYLSYGEFHGNPLAGLGVIVQMVLAVAAVGIALLAYLLASGLRQRTRS